MSTKKKISDIDKAIEEIQCFYSQRPQFADAGYGDRPQLSFAGRALAQ